MALREIVVVDQPVLRKKAKKVEKATPEIRRLIDDLIETMRAAPGVGLAAPQVGVSQRVIVVEYGEDEVQPTEPEGPAPKPVKKRLYTVINPEITYRSEERVEGVEGCLSIPGWAGRVDRHLAVEVKGLNRAGGKFKLKVEGWLARIFQHEIDHLDGILFIDRITRPEDLWRVPPPEEESAEEARAERLG
ncbi:MAG TPA: peptide deformylase [Anaerolineae bacterium]|nr:peptide deformylase [Anaerolineae bacterium]